MASEQALLGGRYELRELLGRGGMATVRRGVDTRLGRPVAVKQLVPNLAADPICQARFQREARAAASLSHPTIVAVFDTGADSDAETGLSIPYLVMELVDGRTLRELLRTGGKVSPERALELTRDVLEALGHSHEAGIVHRDIKPANVMVTSTGGVKVMDFGIARAVAETSTDFTQTASVVGTAHYLSPEQARGEKVGFSSDLYSAGCLLYELLTGRPPFVGESVLSVIYQHVREDPARPSELDPAISPAVDAVVLKALAKDPAERYPTARAMKADIDRVLAGDQPAAAAAVAPAEVAPTAAPAAVADPGVEEEAPGAELAEESAERSRSRRAGLAVGAVLLAVLATLGGYGLYHSSSPEAAAIQLVRIPDVVGRTQAEAEGALQDAHLTARLHPVHGASGATLHTVTQQSPQAGRDAQPGSAVIVDVNDGPVTATIPTDLLGRDAAAVRRELEAAGFRSIRVEQVDTQTNDATPGDVVAVEPAAGTSVPLTQQIVLSVARAVAADTTAITGSTTSASQQPTAAATRSRRRATQEARSTSEPSSPSAAPTTAQSSTPASPSSQPTSDAPSASSPTTTPPSKAPSTSPPPSSPSSTSQPSSSPSTSSTPTAPTTTTPSPKPPHSHHGKHGKKPKG